MLRTAVCDDDKTFLKQFARAVSECFESKGLKAGVSTFSDSSMLLEVHGEQPFDVVFLDIDMPGINGFGAAKSIAERSRDCCIIFVTAHNELVYDSFEFRPLNFLVKQDMTLMLPKLGRVTDQICAVLSDNHCVILEDRLSGRFSARLSDIIYIESCDHDVLYHLRSRAEPIRAAGKLSQLEEEYSAKSFVRIHKRFLVNLRYVFNIDLTRESLMLKTGGELRLGRRYKAETDRRLTEYLRKAR